MRSVTWEEHIVGEQAMPLEQLLHFCEILAAAIQTMDELTEHQ